MIETSTVQLRNDMAKMDAAIASCPDFGKRSAINTERIAKIMRVAPTLSNLDRNQLAVEANQIEVDTNQIEVARSQYAIALNQIVQDAAPLADQIEGACSATQDIQFAQRCTDAKQAVTDFKTSLTRGQSTFLGYKKAVQDELGRQSAIIQRISG